MVAQEHWRKTHIKPTVHTNHLIPRYYHLIPSLYHAHFCNLLLLPYKAFKAVVSFSLHAHTLLTFLFSVMSFRSRLSIYLGTKRALFSWP